MKHKTFLNYRGYKNYCKCDSFRDSVPFTQFKKREKHLWRSKLQSLACNFTKSNTPPWVFFMFFKLHKCYQIVQSVSYNTQMIMMNSLGEIVDRQKVFSLISSQNRCQTFSPPQIPDTPQACFRPTQSLSLDFVTTAPPHLHCSWIIKTFLSKSDFIAQTHLC